MSLDHDHRGNRSQADTPTFPPDQATPVSFLLAYEKALGRGVIREKCDQAG